uniref:Anaphase-promoting complex subunit 2 n=1 Tax=Syphacia muris TaxID=451379 RepID=A0A158R4U9_9BILA
MFLLKQWASHIQLSKQVEAMYADLNKYMKRKVVDCLTKMVTNYFHTLLFLQIYELVIIDYPQSCDLIDDFRHCMQFNGNYGRTEIVNHLSDEIEHRLLHVGAITTEVLEGYAKAVECLRRLDPTCVIMQRVCSLIRNYVKQRPDTVRCIITYITGEKRDELGKQLTKKKAAIIDEEELEGGVNDDLIVENWRDWTADPQDAVVGKSRRFRQNADVFNMLVSVYGSKELFVKEYRQILAERLIKSWNREPQSEMRYIDLLKLRFSEGELQQCEVMLKDIRDSEKIDEFARDSLVGFFPISARIISSFFWPTIESEKFSLPKTMMDGLEAYSKLFEMKKASRTLKWMTGVGCVQMDVIIDGVSMSVSASPAHVAVLAVFLEKEKWTLDEVANYIGMDKRNVKKRLEWWQSSGIITFSAKNAECDSDLWCLVSGQMKMDQPLPEFDAEDESSDDGVEEDAEDIDSLEQYWNYTKGFMVNRQPMKAEKLQSIYRYLMFASPGRQGPSLETVTAFLQRKVKQNLLTYANGFYKVVKNP